MKKPGEGCWIANRRGIPALPAAGWLAPRFASKALIGLRNLQAKSSAEHEHVASVLLGRLATKVRKNLTLRRDARNLHAPNPSTGEALGWIAE